MFGHLHVVVIVDSTEAIVVDVVAFYVVDVVVVVIISVFDLSQLRAMCEVSRSESELELDFRYLLSIAIAVAAWLMALHSLLRYPLVMAAKEKNEIK